MTKLALLDVDDTLLYGPEGDINTALVDELINAGIVDVYLFTNMDLRDVRIYGNTGAPRSRYDLVEYLISRGLNVLGAVTPADKFFSPQEATPGVAYRTLYNPLMKKRRAQQSPLDLTNIADSDTLDYTYGDLKWKRASNLMAEQSALTEGQQADIACVGLRLINNKTREKGAFLTQTEAAEFFAMPGNCQNYSLILDPNPADIVTLVGGHNKDPKGLMIEHFLTLSDDTEFYFFDDRSTHIAGVQRAIDYYNSTSNKPVKLSTCLMPSELSAAMDDTQRLEYKRCLAAPDAQLSPSFLLQVLTHPAVKAIGAVLLLAGVAGIIVGTCGLAGVAVGISALFAKILIGVGAGTTIASGIGFFASSKLSKDEVNEAHPLPQPLS
ncbi:hypothetical protein [Legionella shakespearei]|nr:hypothetical protein [Legionella shakespearei]